MRRTLRRFSMLVLLVLLGLLVAAAPARAANGRVYLGPAAGSGKTQGEGFVLGWQSAGGAEVGQGYWGAQILGVRIGDANAFLPLISLDAGFQWTPFPKGFLRPHAQAGVNATFLLILPLPGIHAGLGVGVPIGEAIVVDLSFMLRQAFNPFDTTNNPTVASIELGLGM